MKRDYYFDNAKFILIFLVVAGHVISPYRHDEQWLLTLYQFIYTFHMPAFILLAGYFSSNFDKKGYYVKIITRLAIPYVILQTIYTVYYNGLYPNTTFDLQYFTPRWAMWFLLSMIAWKLLLPIFAKYRWSITLPIVFLIGLLVGFIQVPERFLSLDRTFYFFPFFLIGYYLSKTDLFSIIRKNQGKYQLISAGFMGILLIGIFISTKDFGSGSAVLYGTNVYESMSDMYLRVFMYTISFFVTISFFTFIPASQNVFTGIGSRSFYVYILHGFIIKWFFETTLGQSVQSIPDYFLLFIISILVTILTGNAIIVRMIRKPFLYVKETLSIKNG